LEALCLSCVNINADLKDLVEEKHRGSKPLQLLVLTECNINHAGLAAILSLPRALTHLNLSTSSGGCVCFSAYSRLVGENHDNARVFGGPISPCHNYLFFDYAAETMAALEQQKHSLESVSYAGAVSEGMDKYRSRQSADVIDGAFSAFPQLREISLHRPCAAFERAVMANRLPPNLKILCYKAKFPFFNVCGEAFNPETGDDSLSSLAAMRLPFLHAADRPVPPALHALIVTVEEADVSYTLSLKTLRGFIHESAQTLLAKGVELSVLACDATNYYPPYLYGEEHPYEESVYHARFQPTFYSPDLFSDSDSDSEDDDARPGSSAVEEPEVPIVI
jgi:hypothetical protein